VASAWLGDINGIGSMLLSEISQCLPSVLQAEVRKKRTDPFVRLRLTLLSGKLC
jgi:hypothetical protein